MYKDNLFLVVLVCRKLPQNIHTYSHHLSKYEGILTKSFGVKYSRTHLIRHRLSRQFA